MYELPSITATNEFGICTVEVSGPCWSNTPQEIGKVLETVRTEPLLGVLLILKADRNLSSAVIRYVVELGRDMPQLAVVLASATTLKLFEAIGFDQAEPTTHHFKAFVPESGRALPDRVDAAIARAKSYLLQPK